MNLHLMPLSDELNDKVQHRLDTECTKWLESWLNKTNEKTEAKVTISVASKSDVLTFLERDASQFFESNAFVAAFRLSESSEAFLLEAITGCSKSVLSNSGLNQKKLIASMVRDFLLQIVKNEDVHQDSKMTVFENVEQCPESVPNIFGFFVTVLYKGMTLDWYFSNRFIKQLLRFSSEYSNTLSLDSREAAVQDLQVKIDARITGFTLSLHDLKTLQVGDVLTTRESKAQQISVFSKEKRIRKGQVKLGKKDENFAIKIG